MSLGGRDGDQRRVVVISAANGQRAGFADPAEINGRVERLSRERAQMYAGRKRADFNACVGAGLRLLAEA